MTKPHAKRSTTRVSRTINAPRTDVFQAFINPDALEAWRAPDNMKAHIHNFEACEGGTYRMSLTYQDPDDGPGGKTTSDTDTFQSTFLEIVKNEKIVEKIEFETKDPGFEGKMTMTTIFEDIAGRTKVTILTEDIPPGIRPEDNELGCKLSLRNLANYLAGTLT